MPIPLVSFNVLDPQSWNHNPVRKSCDGLNVNALLSLHIALRLKATSYAIGTEFK